MLTAYLTAYIVCISAGFAVGIAAAALIACGGKSDD